MWKASRRVIPMCLMLLVWFCGGRAAHGADIPLGTAFTYQGTLQDGGVAATGDYDFRFSLWDADAGGLQVGPPLGVAAVPLEEGTFTAELDFGFGMFNGAARWLEIEVRPAGGGAYTLLTPRQPLTAAPYAQALRLPFYGTQAQNGATLGITNPHASGTAGWFRVSEPTNTHEAVMGINDGVGAGVRGSGYYGLRGETPSSAGYAVYGRNDNGNYGYIGDDNNALFGYNANSGNYVIAGGNDYGLRATAGTPTTRSGAGLIGNSDDSFGVYGTTNSKIGVMGYVNSTAIYLYDNSGICGYSTDGYGASAVTDSGTAVMGWHRDTSNNGRLGHPEYGVYGRSTVRDGVRGRTDSTDASVAGVYGVVQSTSPGSYSAGVRGENRGTGGLGIGVWGSHEGSGWGVLGESPDGVGVYGSSTSGYAGYFGGNVTVTGSLAKGGGSFKIDHPLDPENRFLLHSFVESPDMMNIYNGNVVTDDKGYAWVEMPDWFESLNRDFRYQLTVIGQFAQAIVADTMQDGRFRIRTDVPGVEVSWQVTGIRQDAWAEANRIPVEQDKSPAEQGRYLHAAAWGQPAERAIDFQPAPEPASRPAEAEPSGPTYEAPGREDVTE